MAVNTEVPSVCGQAKQAGWICDAMPLLWLARDGARRDNQLPVKSSDVRSSVTEVRVLLQEDVYLTNDIFFQISPQPSISPMSALTSSRQRLEQHDP